MKESTLCSSITDSSARHTRPPAGKTPHWAGLRDSQANSPTSTLHPHTHTMYLKEAETLRRHTPCVKTPHVR